MNANIDKKQLRAQLRRRRREMPRGRIETLSCRICENVRAGAEYKDCKLLMCFMSTDIEVDTSSLISAAFADGKRVAIPRCIESDGGRGMEFCVIDSPEDTVIGEYGLREPPQGKHVVSVEETACALCIVPGLAYDTDGYRIGFGGGYYDRYLPDFRGVSCGVCFEEFTVGSLSRESTDIAVDILVTESYVKRK